jgi:hypothetical protein
MFGNCSLDTYWEGGLMVSQIAVEYLPGISSLTFFNGGWPEDPETCSDNCYFDFKEIRYSGSV